MTFPRSKYSILGKRADGLEVEGEYFTGNTVSVERRFSLERFQDKSTFTTEIDDPETLITMKRSLVALIDGIPQSEVNKDSAFVVSE